MVIYKRQVIEADQFKVKFSNADTTFPGIALDDTASTGMYKVSDTEVAILLNSTDSLNIKRGEIRLYDNGAINGSNISLFISGGELYYKGSAGTLTRLGVA